MADHIDELAARILGTVCYMTDAAAREWLTHLLRDHSREILASVLATMGDDVEALRAQLLPTDLESLRVLRLELDRRMAELYATMPVTNNGIGGSPVTFASLAAANVEKQAWGEGWSVGECGTRYVLVKEGKKCPECGGSGYAVHPENGSVPNSRRCSRGCAVWCSICNDPNCSNPSGQH